MGDALSGHRSAGRPEAHLGRHEDDRSQLAHRSPECRRRAAATATSASAAASAATSGRVIAADQQSGEGEVLTHHSPPGDLAGQYPRRWRWGHLCGGSHLLPTLR